VVNLGPTTREELREAIERPAGVVSFESGLVDSILDDVASRPGNLPLLQLALREMWGRLDRRCMTRASYDAIGGVEGAPARRAQAIFDEGTCKGENEHAVTVFRRLFTRLVTLGEDFEDTRRIVARQELGAEEWALAQRLADEGNRLVVTGAPAPDHETVEVAHEALIRNWPELSAWVSRDRAFHSWLRQLKPRLDDWRKLPTDDGTLLRGSPLAVAEDWLARRRDDLSEEERLYVEASIASREAEHERKDEARKQAADAQRRRVRNRNIALVAASILAVLAGLLGWRAEQQRIKADELRETAEEQRKQVDDILAGATKIIVKLQHQMDIETKKRVFAVFHTGADHGDSASMRNLGLSYANGWGVAQDYA
jgi:hypothetical protein